jgi:hypothetical protein
MRTDSEGSVARTYLGITNDRGGAGDEQYGRRRQILPPDRRQGRDKCSLLRIRTESLRTAVSVSGKREFPARDKRAGKAAKIRMALGRDDVHTRKPANSGLFIMNREISVCVGLRGGAGRTRTSNQTIISRQS